MAHPSPFNWCVFCLFPPFSSPLFLFFFYFSSSFIHTADELLGNGFTLLPGIHRESLCRCRKDSHVRWDVLSAAQGQSLSNWAAGIASHQRVTTFMLSPVGRFKSDFGVGLSATPQSPLPLSLSSHACDCGVLLRQNNTCAILSKHHTTLQASSCNNQLCLRRLI